MAERAYAAAARLGKDDPDIQNNYAGFLCRSGKTAAGEKLFAEVARNPLYQTPEVALVNAGVCVRGTGDMLDAQRYFNHALAIRPNMPEALLQLGASPSIRGMAPRRSSSCSASSQSTRQLRKCSGWVSARNASWAMPRRRQASRGACKPSFPTPSRPK